MRHLYLPAVALPEDCVIGRDQLHEDSGKHPNSMDKKSLHVRLRVGWVKGLNRLYFLYEAYDKSLGLFAHGSAQRRLRLVVDGDLSGGPLIPFCAATP